VAYTWLMRTPTVLSGLLVLSTLGAVSPALAASPVQTVSFVGGSGDDSVRAGVVLDDGTLFLAGTSNSSSVFPGEERLEPGDGFIVMLDASGTVRLSTLRSGPVLAALQGPGQEIALAGGKTVRGFSTATKKFTWSSDDLGADVSKLARTKDGYVALAGTKVIALDGSGKARWSVSVAKSRVSAIAADANYVYIGGDQNTNTGQEPYRSPYVYRYDLASGTPSSDWKLYDWAGPDVRANGKSLQADSFVNELKVDPAGKLWMCAGSDGGNTVLTKGARNLDSVQSALMGACYDGPCFGYKGAKKTGMFASVKADAPELERATWVIPYLMPKDGRNSPPCGCKSNPANPNSMTIEDLAFSKDAIVAASTTSYRPPESDNAWFRDTVYASGMTWVGLFTPDLKSISMGTMIPGTKGPEGAVVRGGRLLVFGSAGDTSMVKPSNPGEDTWATKLPVSAPAGKTPPQTAYGGGKTDGYFLLACVGSEAECDAAPGPMPDPGSSSGAPGSSGASGMSTSGAGPASSGNTAGPAAGPANDTGCGCGTSAQTAAPWSAILLGCVAWMTSRLRLRFQRKTGKAIRQGF
jgi:hypothetical protein